MSTIQWKDTQGEEGLFVKIEGDKVLFVYQKEKGGLTSHSIPKQAILDMAELLTHNELNNHKTITNLCTQNERCILEIDGGYFGYDNDPAYPETIYKNKKDAYIFKNPKEAIGMTTWLTGIHFTLRPIEYVIPDTAAGVNK